VLPEASRYAQTMMFAMPGVIVSILVMQLLRGMGDTITPLHALLLSNLLACVITPAFISGWAGLPCLGVTSAAISTIVAIITSFVYVGWRMRRAGHPLTPSRLLLRALRIDPHVLSVVLKIGVPMGVQMVVASIAQLVLVSLVNRFGSEATAAYGAIYQLMSYAQFPAMSIGIATSILGAQAIGAGRVEQLGALTRTGMQMNVLVTGPLVVAGYLFSDRLLAMFITDPSVLTLAVSFLRIILWSSVVYGWAAVLSGIMRASGTVYVPTAIAVFCIAVIEVPSAYALSHSVGLRGVWMAYPIASTSVLLQTLFYKLVWSSRTASQLI